MLSYLNDHFSVSHRGSKTVKQITIITSPQHVNNMALQFNPVSMSKSNNALTSHR